MEALIAFHISGTQIESACEEAKSYTVWISEGGSSNVHINTNRALVRSLNINTITTCTDERIPRAKIKRVYASLKGLVKASKNTMHNPSKRLRERPISPQRNNDK